MSVGLETLLVGLFGGLALIGIRLSLYFMSREEVRRPVPAAPEVRPEIAAAIPQPRTELAAQNPQPTA